ncbi:hypothetical protein [Streptomyces sp. NPDC012825]|uniref:hypothetical protein n=1 Tax=Streptomyces sp. NPDC012825 TaxID=3364851 RepID=UPI0036A7B6AC
MRRHPHRSVLAAVVGALLMSVALCFPPLDGAAHTRAVGHVATAATVAPHSGHTGEPAPRHHHHHHGADCAAPGLAPQTAAAQYEAEAAATEPAFDDSPTPLRLRVPTFAGSRKAVADTGRSTLIRVRRWRV